MTAKPSYNSETTRWRAIVPTTTTSKTGNRSIYLRPSRMFATTKIDRPVLCREFNDGVPRGRYPNLVERAVRIDVRTEHAAEHRDANLNPDACQKPDQHRA